MSQKERERLVELNLISGGHQSLASAGRRLGLSSRQMRRIWLRYQREGDSGLVHRGRGRASNRRLPESFRLSCLELYRERLDGFGPTLASEKLADWGKEVDHETLRRWLVQAGLWKVRRRRQKHRSRRPRKEHFGELVQLDGSFHDWFGREDGSHSCLMSMIDDATGRRLSLINSEETTVDAMLLLEKWILRYGLPRAVYVDRKSVYVVKREPTIQEQLAGKEPASAFGSACQKLGIKIIAANSPQAKGRVERSHRVYQDRLVKEIQLQGLESYEQVNHLLQSFDEDLDTRFAVPSARAEDFHRSLPEGLELSNVLVIEQERTVANDWTVRFEKQWFQISGKSRSLPPAKSKVMMQRRLDGSLRMEYRGQSVEFSKLQEKPRKPQAEAERKAPRKEWRPAPDHPWRRPFTRKQMRRQNPTSP